MARLSTVQEVVFEIAAILRVVASHCSVPLLSVISGWLFVVTFKDDVGRTLLSKLRTLIMPLVLWNLVMALVYLASSLVIDPQWTLSTAPIDLLNDFLAFADRPLNGPLYFLRDIFVCSLAGLAIMALARRGGRGVLWAALAAAMVLAILMPRSFVMQRAVILPSFVIGMIIAQSRTDVMNLRFVPRWLFASSLLGLIAIYGMIRWEVISMEIGLAGQVLELAYRVLLAICGWYLIRALTGQPFSMRLAALERYVFFIFCSHFVLFMSLSAIAVRLLGERNPLLINLFLVEPLLAFVAGAAAFELLARYAAPVLGLLNGGRVRGRPQGQPTPPAADAVKPLAPAG